MIDPKLDPHLRDRSTNDFNFADKRRIVKYILQNGNFVELFKMFEIHKRNFGDMSWSQFQKLLTELISEKRIISNQNAWGSTYWEVNKN